MFQYSFYLSVPISSHVLPLTNKARNIFVFVHSLTQSWGCGEERETARDPLCSLSALLASGTRPSVAPSYSKFQRPHAAPTLLWTAALWEWRGIALWGRGALPCGVEGHCSVGLEGHYPGGLEGYYHGGWRSTTRGVEGHCPVRVKGHCPVGLEGHCPTGVEGHCPGGGGALPLAFNLGLLQQSRDLGKYSPGD